MNSWKRADSELRDKGGGWRDEARDSEEWNGAEKGRWNVVKYVLCGNEMLKVSCCLPFHHMTALAGCRDTASQNMQVIVLGPELASPRQTHRRLTQQNISHSLCERSQQPNLWW